MPFVDSELIAGLVGKTVSGLALSQGAPMQLDVAAGSVIEHQTGVTHTLAAVESHTFVADGVKDTRCFVGLITDDGANVDVWVDSYVDDGKTGRAPLPAGFRLVADLAWFTIPANETDLANVTINRRVWQ